MLREILDKTAERVGKDLTNQPEVEIELRLTLAQTYDELGLYNQEEEMARKSLQLAQSRPARKTRLSPARSSVLAPSSGSSATMAKLRYTHAMGW